MDYTKRKNRNSWFMCTCIFIWLVEFLKIVHFSKLSDSFMRMLQNRKHFNYSRQKQPISKTCRQLLSENKKKILQNTHILHTCYFKPTSYARTKNQSNGVRSHTHGHSYRLKLRKCVKNPVRSLRWSFFKKQLMADDVNSLLQ